MKTTLILKQLIFLLQKINFETISFVKATLIIKHRKY